MQAHTHTHACTHVHTHTHAHTHTLTHAPTHAQVNTSKRTSSVADTSCASPPARSSSTAPGLGGQWPCTGWAAHACCCCSGCCGGGSGGGGGCGGGPRRWFPCWSPPPARTSCVLLPGTSEPLVPLINWKGAGRGWGGCSACSTSEAGPVGTGGVAGGVLGSRGQARWMSALCPKAVSAFAGRGASGSTAPCSWLTG